MPAQNHVSDEDDDDDVPHGSQAHSLLRSMGKAAAPTSRRQHTTSVRTKHVSALTQVIVSHRKGKKQVETMIYSCF